MPARQDELFTRRPWARLREKCRDCAQNGKRRVGAEANPAARRSLNLGPCPSTTPTSRGMFEEIADLLEIGDANPFRVRAYRNAARVVGELQLDIAATIGRRAGRCPSCRASARISPARSTRSPPPATARARPAAPDAAARDHRAAAHSRHRPEAREERSITSSTCRRCRSSTRRRARGASASCPASARRPRRTSCRRPGASLEGAALQARGRRAVRRCARRIPAQDARSARLRRRGQPPTHARDGRRRRHPGDGCRARAPCMRASSHTRR